MSRFMISAIDLFAGAGGLSLGLQMAGIEIVAAVEADQHCASTLALHLPYASIYDDDIRHVDLSIYRRKVELVIGGPPCQPFSSGGLRASSSDARDMMPYFLKAIEEIQPQAFLMENVRGLIVGQRSYYFNSLIIEFQNLGYQVNWKVLNAADYGVPQKRLRLFMVGMKEKSFVFPEPTHGKDKKSPHVAVKKVLPQEQIGKSNTAKITYAKRPDLRPSPYHGQLFNGGGRPINLEEPSPTILASAGGNKTHFIDKLNLVPPYHSYLLNGGEPKTGVLPGARRLTVEESALIQTFPKDTIFTGPRTSQYTQVGNAVPPRLGLILGERILKQIKEEDIPENGLSTLCQKTTVQQFSLFSPLNSQMPKSKQTDNNRNIYVERAVNSALKRIDDFISGEELENLPSQNYRRACDKVLRDRSASARVAGLFLAFYRLEDKDWDLSKVPKGVRGKYGDKRLSNELTKRCLTLHGNITAFGENLGWKGDVDQVDLSTESHFKDWTKAVLGANEDEQRLMADYFASRFAQSRIVLDPLPPIGENILTFAKSKQLFSRVLGLQSNGYIQQFLIAALLFEFRQFQGIEVITHHPNASDTYDNSAGDIEEKKEGILLRAYEVTMRPDWQNRISDFRNKMDKFGLSKYTIIASGINKDSHWSVPAQMALTLDEYGRDIAIIDIEDVVNFLAAELSSEQLRKAINHTYDYLTNPRLCGRQDFIDAYHEAVDQWLDQAVDNRTQN